jgi:DNA-binding MarR family transcriptional regulator
MAVSKRLNPAELHHGNEPHLLREIVRTHQTLMAAFSRHVGMPASQFAVIRTLATSERDLGTIELARQLGIDAAAVTRLVKEMDAEGLVQRRQDAKDGRRSYITLSPKGLRTFKGLHERSHMLEHSLLSWITTEEMAVTARVLSRLRDGLDRLNG